MPELLEGKVAIVTGAGRGVGRAHAIALANHGARVIVNNPTKLPADEVVEEIRKAGGIAVVNNDSVATSEGAEAIIKAALDNFGHLDILVNNAGVLRDRMIFNMTDEEWDAVIKVHLYGTFYCTRSACKLMREQRSGRIINTYAVGDVGQANYGAAKEGVAGLTRIVAKEMSRYGVTCNAIRPYAATRLTLNPQVIEAWKRTMEPEVFGVRKKRLETSLPEDISPLVVYLASEEARSISGCVFDAYRSFIALYDEPPHVARAVIKEEARWTPEELVEIIPQTLTSGMTGELPPKEGVAPLPDAKAWKWDGRLLKEIPTFPSIR